MSVKKVLIAGAFAVSMAFSAATMAAEMNKVTHLDHTLMPAVVKMQKLPSSVLLAGNSFMYYNNGVVQWAQGLIDATPELKGKMSLSMVTIAYSGIDWHDMKSYFRPNAINSYTTLNDGSNKLLFRSAKGPVFDAVVMQDNSQGPTHPELRKFFAKYAKEHSDTIRSNGAVPLVMMTWGYADRPEMTRQLADATIKVANENKIMVVPVGLAFAEAKKGNPDIKLIIKDNRHPSVLGTYLEACVLYSTLTQRSPEGLKWYSVGELSVDPATALYLQKVAWTTTKNFFGW